jgi:N-acyl-D-amino-acid deacylase
VAAAALLALTAAAAPAQPTGEALPGLEPYDRLMAGLLRKWRVPGGALAVARDGRILLARGYGLADRARGTPVEPTSLFRLASLSKTVTAVAALQLVQEGRLELDARVLPLLGEIGPRTDKIADRRVRDITVRHLLQHTAGFDRDKSGDPMFMPYAAAAAKRQGGALPPDCPTIMRDTLERRLDFAPGARFEYSNVGYCILGRVIERVTGAPYEAHVRERILTPAGAARMQVGRTRETAEGEVTYYDYEAKEYPAMPGLGVIQATRPYGGFALETMDAYGGWIGAPADYLRFLLAIDGRRGPALLSAPTLARMNAQVGLEAASAGEDSIPMGSFYGLGVRVRPVKGGLNIWHFGSLPGTVTIALRSADDFAWVVAFNGRPADRNGFRHEVDRGLWEVKAKVKVWPAGDLAAAGR